MKTVARLRAMGSLCRQHAAYHPDQSWKLLAEAEFWEHMADVEMSLHFQECNASSSSDMVKPGTPSNGNDKLSTTPVAA